MSKKSKIEEAQNPNTQERRFSLEQLSQRWNKPVSEIKEDLRLCKFKRVVLRHYRSPDRSKISKLVNPPSWIEHTYLDETLWPYGECDRASVCGNRLMSEVAVLVDKPTLASGFYWNKNSEIWIPEDEVLRFEQINNLTLELEPPASPPNKLWEWIKPKELRIAVRAYHDLYLGKEINLMGSHKPQIKAWLKKRYPHLNQNQLDHIMYMVNCNKDGGAPMQ